MKNRRKAVQPFEIKKRKIDIFRNYEAYGFEKNQRKFENFSTLISKKSTTNKRCIAHDLVATYDWFLFRHVDPFNFKNDWSRAIRTTGNHGVFFLHPAFHNRTALQTGVDIP